MSREQQYRAFLDAAQDLQTALAKLAEKPSTENEHRRDECVRQMVAASLPTAHLLRADLSRAQSRGGPIIW